MLRCFPAPRLVVLLLLGLLASKAFAENFDRNLEPVVVSGDAFSFLAEHPVSALFLYAFRAESQTWQQIPFQIDERDASGSFFNAGGDETLGLDANDDLVFMTKDGGSKNDFSWIADLDSRNFVRYEIGVKDPLSGGVVFAYLYASNQLLPDPNLTDYVTYNPAPSGSPGEDGVASIFYDMQHGANGLPEDISVTALGGGSAVDLLDRLKFRAGASLIINVNVTEDALRFEDGDFVRARDGMIRVIREVKATMNIRLGFFGSLNVDMPIMPTVFYPYSSSLSIRIPEIGSASVSDGRISLDLNSSANGMKFVSANNPEPGFAIDGQPDEHVREVDSVLPSGNWIHTGGTAGTIVSLFPIELTVGGRREFYYKDDSGNDGDDTGDGRSFADAGISMLDGVATPFTIGYKGYYLARDLPSTTSSDIASFEANPFQLTVIPEDFATVPVELVSFSSQVLDEEILLTWDTATESNNLGFEVERRFAEAEAWQNLGFVRGKGTTSVPQAYEFADRDLSAGLREYRLKQIDTDGSFEYSNMIQVTVTRPVVFALHQNFPNPFNPATIINFEVSDKAGSQAIQTSLTVFDVLGREVAGLLNDSLPAGTHSVIWDGTGSDGLPAASGLYIYRLQSGNSVQTRKMLLLR